MALVSCPHGGRTTPAILKGPPGVAETAWIISEFVVHSFRPQPLTMCDANMCHFPSPSHSIMEPPQVLSLPGSRSPPCLDDSTRSRTSHVPPFHPASQTHFPGCCGLEVCLIHSPFIAQSTAVRQADDDNANPCHNSRHAQQARNGRRRVFVIPPLSLWGVVLDSDTCSFLPLVFATAWYLLLIQWLLEQ